MSAAVDRETLEVAIEILDGVTLEVLKTLSFQVDRKSKIPGLDFSFSPDSHFITLCAGERIIKWDLQTGREVVQFSAQHRKARSSTYSMDGKLFAVLFEDSSNGVFTMITYDLLSGTHAGPRRSLEGRVITPIWTHGEYIRFATVEQESVTISEVGFTLARGPVEVQSFPAPDGVAHEKTRHLFLPTLSRLAFTQKGDVSIWDAQDAKLLLNSTNGWYTKMTFSSNGRFFASLAIRHQEVRVLKDSPTGYQLRQKIPSPINFFGTPGPVLSPSGGSIITMVCQGFQLWSTANQILSPSDLANQNSEVRFVLTFSPDKSLAAVVRLNQSKVTVVDLKSGANPRLVVDTGTRVRFLGVTGSMLVVAGDENVAAWTIPTGYHAPNAPARVGIDDRVWVTTLDHPGLSPDDQFVTISMSISPNLDHIAIVKGATGSADLNVYDLRTGKRLGGASTTWVLPPEFTPDGREVWIIGPSLAEGWAIPENNETGLIRLKPPDRIPRPPWPSRKSPGGHHVRNGWVLDSAQKRILWLPRSWRVAGTTGIWVEQFLGLVHRELSEAVILEFLE